ncbi:hypothetical protein E4U24_008483 [Claviceps purpurea]|nr:hypothetical protein E4U12_006355 [Claviceps purpurea]KAG6144776.1 hypothetical protein E4U28_001869 [Claviceps purpurea]KAG6167243.1 hypothetical protein E4U51_003056 [Claviceps purpurea]KAG6182869.1 hypothetical protein E4U36_003071 [Claviceps purpurea]KAG6188739.1 hypothetical protein E4U27_007018 [Claviceps purpurea]
MKPIISAMHAWSCTVISVFAIVILSVLAVLYRSGHEELVGGINDPSPEQGKAVAGTIFTAVLVYAVCDPPIEASGHKEAFIRTSILQLRMQAFLVFCGFQGLLHVRENRRGAIAL